MAAGVRIWELGVGSKGGCGCAKRGAASPDWRPLSHRDFGIHAATVGFEEGGRRGRLRKFFADSAARTSFYRRGRRGMRRTTTRWCIPMDFGINALRGFAQIK